MNSDVVYQVVKALPIEEQKLLLDKLKNDSEIYPTLNSLKKVEVFSKEKAITYLLENVFNNRKYQTKSILQGLSVKRTFK
jgi:hypothetical protein